ncbi:hypothetical protein Aperf_G00000132670 [Anoplocephala perfoliata]
MDAADFRRRAAVKSSQLLRNMDALAEVQVVEARKKYNVKDNATLGMGQPDLDRFMRAGAKRLEESKRQMARGIAGPLSDSDSGDGASSDEEWLPTGSSSLSQSNRSRKKSAEVFSTLKFGSDASVVSWRHSGGSKSPIRKISGGLAEPHSESHSGRNMARENYRNPPPDLYDDRYLFPVLRS